jgi:hypothetical protein
VLVPAIAVVAMSLALSAWAGVRLARNRPVILRQLIAGGVVEVALLVQLVVGGVLVAAGHVLDDALTFWGYLAVSLLVLPGAAAWAFADRTRWSSAVLAVAGLTVAVMEVRMLQVWGQVVVP